ncbi:unnamed protein product, partial [marine sediment metagenome]
GGIKTRPQEKPNFFGHKLMSAWGQVSKVNGGTF